MAHKIKSIVLASALLAGVAAPSLAQQSTGDSPGGGGTRVVKPVTGAQVYRQVCQACHMADAKGGSGAGTIPALAANPKLKFESYPITVVVRGKGAMPSFTGFLNQKQVAEVVTYIRTNFGNNYPAPVTEAQVNKLWVAPPRADH